MGSTPVCKMYQETCSILHLMHSETFKPDPSLGVRQLPVAGQVPLGLILSYSSHFHLQAAQFLQTRSYSSWHKLLNRTKRERRRTYIITSSLQPGPYKNIYTHTCSNIQLRLCTVEICKLRRVLLLPPRAACPSFIHPRRLASCSKVLQNVPQLQSGRERVPRR